MAERGMGESKDNPHLADRAALLTRAAKHDVDKAALHRTWQRQAKALGFSAGKVLSQARKAERNLLGPDLFAGPGYAAGDAAAWAVAHLAERQAVFGHADLLAATLAREPGAVTVDAAERAIAALERDGALHAARGLDHGRHWSTDAALARESETIALMRAGPGGGEDGDAPLGRGNETAPGPAQRGPEGSRQDRPRRQGSRGRGPRATRARGRRRC